MKKWLVVLFIGLAGCASLEPYVREFNIISVPQERQIGLEAAGQVAREMALVEDPAALQRVRQIGQRLVSALPRRDFDYHFYVVQDDSPNAFTIPGGSVYVHTGLLKMADDDELAGVIGHEIGHAYARHPVKGLSRAYGVEYLSRILFSGNQPRIQNLGLMIAEKSLLLRYGREDEFEADQIGFALLKRAGLRTDGLLRFFAKLQNLERGGFNVPFLSSHPPTAERMARLQTLEQRDQNISAGTFPNVPG